MLAPAVECIHSRTRLELQEMQEPFPQHRKLQIQQHPSRPRPDFFRRPRNDLSSKPPELLRGLALPFGTTGRHPPAIETKKKQLLCNEQRVSELTRASSSYLLLLIQAIFRAVDKPRGRSCAESLRARSKNQTAPESINTTARRLEVFLRAEKCKYFNKA